ncbi:hypothetical protein SPAR_36256 [Streptomyces sparsogenes DSM 40356]|uniref:Uncharacterized protein n=2 Tax=Streptomyces sparsogenes TaxID=67365 RepID=A0A1R1S7Z8_9ACTN|nr:hypothetical protein [Streptomyces sparsogenes]OMI34353.1 hypothetical protein SPAR_36256 [Streptomyces sparsogenes DSM 40356]
MTSRSDLIETLRASRAVMSENEAAYKAYIKARDEANAAFCQYSNRFGLRDALAAKREADADSPDAMPVTFDHA